MIFNVKQKSYAAYVSAPSLNSIEKFWVHSCSGTRICLKYDYDVVFSDRVSCDLKYIQRKNYNIYMNRVKWFVS
jgi:hypothetical protein